MYQDKPFDLLKPLPVVNLAHCPPAKNHLPATAWATHSPETMHDIAHCYRMGYEETLYSLLYGCRPTAQELFSYKNQIRRFMLADSEIKKFLATIEKGLQPPLDLLQTLLISMVTDKKMTGTYLIVRAFYLTANSFNKERGLPLVAPRAELNLIENFLYMTGLEYHGPRLLNHVTRIMTVMTQSAVLQCYRTSEVEKTATIKALFAKPRPRNLTSLLESPVLNKNVLHWLVLLSQLSRGFVQQYLAA